MRIVRIDSNDDKAFVEYYETFARGEAFDRTDTTLWTYDEARQSVSPGQEFFLVMEDDVPLGAGDLEFGEKELRFAFAVPPEHRGRGAGQLLVQHVEAIARADGSERLVTEVTLTAARLESAPASGFLERRGFLPGHAEFRSQLKLPVEPPEIPDTGLRLTSWVGACPSEYAAEFAALQGLTEVELRAIEASWEIRERVTINTIGLTSEGSIVGCTQLVVPEHEPQRVYEHLTVADRDELGLALRATNLWLVQKDYPDVDRVDSWSAPGDHRMLEIDRALGFELIEVQRTWTLDRK